MFKIIVVQSIAAAAVAVLAGLAIVLTDVAPEVKAESSVGGAHHQPRAKGDRLPMLVAGVACSSRGWPHYEQRCQFDLRMPAIEARTVRIISLRQ
jgi:hypothetical protein